MTPKDLYALPSHSLARLEARQSLKNEENRAMRSGWLQYAHEERR